ncbi:lipopolysaccharide export system protein LptC [Roseomonas rosea]|uniref:Lipopolysaccharide export system protein LptC n=1 Tax=Muricoccus roseus TaxID=198092 RepID=A0A1M6EDU8_9PROT|nr:LPS export ABC transporter periplasmic protein LptC [Roseomonas rosea]SHI83655.1 lipopolysaccharide export system protein LptC [Roseomonas rosea]
MPAGPGWARPPSPGAEALPDWRERPVPSRARRIYTRGSILRRRFAVRFLKYVLPLGALALLSAIVLWPEFEREGENARLSFRRMSRAAPESVRVVDPRYQGVDEQGRPFNVTAFTASQQGSTNVVELEAPRGDLVLSGGGWMLVESRDGRFDRNANILDLRRDVTIWQDDGTLIETQEARVDVKGGNAEGDRPIAAQGTFGTITGDGFRLRDRGTVVVFTGNARAVLEGGQ